MYELLAKLLSYPDEEADWAKPPVPGDSPAAALIVNFAGEAARLGLARMQEIYTRTFDLQLESAPYVGHQLFGEDWRRSLFMAGLRHRYEEVHLGCGTEMPDYLPLVLRFLEIAPAGDERDELIHACVVPAARKILRAIESTENPYAGLMNALLLWLAPEGTEIQEEAACEPSVSSCFPILP